MAEYHGYRENQEHDQDWLSEDDSLIRSRELDSSKTEGLKSPVTAGTVQSCSWSDQGVLVQGNVSQSRDDATGQ